jgi:hypothetical protein
VKFTKAKDLVLTGVVAAVVVTFVLVVGYDSLPPLPTFAGATLLLIAVGEVAAAFTLRPRIARKPGADPVHPLTAARLVALAKASSLLGAIMAGAWVAVLAYVLPRRAEMTAAAGDTPSAVIGLVSAAALIAAALWLEHCCRAPDDRNRRDDSELPRSR